ncbi:MAG: DUF2225 domain-containing protein [Agathobacter sp.]|nr:DUF2225 domain-containing protein [Agathobacter sp.]
MSLLSGLEKFGLDEMKMDNLFEESTTKKVVIETGETKVLPPEEKDFLLMKSIRCPVCDAVFRSRMVKAGRAKRLESDKDLRPRFQYIDTNKYDVSSCPNCGYTAINRYFPHLSQVQVKMMEETVRSKFKSSPIDLHEEVSAYDYDTAIERYKLALYCTLVKKGQTSEKAYECLKLAWLYRGKREELLEKDPEQKDSKELIAQCEKDELTYYTQAFEGFQKAISSENYPMAGMDQSTVDMLVASMAMRLGKYDVASRFVSGILVSQAANRNIKNKALIMKEEILEAVKKQNS